MLCGVCEKNAENIREKEPFSEVSRSKVHLYSEFGVSSRKKRTALILCLCLGIFGAHRFYLGRVWTGIYYLFTLGIFGLGVLLDIYLLCTDRLPDKNGQDLI